MSKKYTTLHISQMKHLQAEGLTAQQIAESLTRFYPGITRCAVLGVLFRERRK